jgi:hypothetical protein
VGLEHCDPQWPRAPFRELLAVVAQNTRLRVLSMSLQLHTVRLYGRQQTRWVHSACGSQSALAQHILGQLILLRSKGMLYNLEHTPASRCGARQPGP